VSKLIVINKETVRVFLKGDTSNSSPKTFSFRIGSVEDFENKMNAIQTQIGMKSIDKVPILYHDESSLLKEASRFLPTLLLALIGFRIIFRNFNPAGRGRGGLFNIGKSNAKLFNRQDKVNVAFNDVAGMPEAKQEIQEFVDFLKNPKKYEMLGARIPKGALLVGPPGTGKTLLAKATAGEASVPFLSTSGSDFIEMFVGVGPARVRDLFETARENSPCIIFIDEIDAIGRARGRGGYFGGNDERENTLNQILVEMDGFASSSGVVVLAGTNRPDVLDKALLRPGRFDRQIAIDKPDVSARKDIFLVHLKPLKLDIPENIEEYAKKMASFTPGFSGADIANACNEAALIAARRNANEVTMKDLESALDRVIAGLEKKSKVLSQKEKRTVAYHEAGHALLGWFLEHADPVLKVSIVPRGSSALGYTQYLPSDQFIVRKEKLDDMMCMALGGRVAEELIFGSITTGAQDDLDRVSQLGYSQVKLYGMNEKIGPFSFPQEEGGLRPYSEETATLIDEEVRSMVLVAHNRAKQLMNEHREGLEKLAAVLLEKEVIGFDDLTVVFGPRPWKTTIPTA
jgi:AFG3 family protein